MRFLRLFRRLLRLPAPAALSLLYLALIVVGSLLLWMPLARTGPLSFWDALFTSVSAVTVTGLGVVDPGSTFTPFGQAVIAILIQFGGLGLMAFATLVLIALGIRFSLPHRNMLREDLDQTSIGSLWALVRTIFAVALVCEAVGTVILSFAFVPVFGWGTGIWHALFHAVSAFNNAGFALYPDGLSRWVGDPVVNLGVPALFMIGGIGFVVLAEIADKRNWQRLSLHSKVTLAGTLVLTVVPVAGFALLEWSNPATLGGLDVPARLWASWFQAVTPRTAGFNTIDIAGLHDSTTLMTMFLMMVGGGSTSTAGGIKVTTLVILALATVAFFRRRTVPHMFSRSIGTDEVLKALALATVSMGLVLTAIFLLTVAHDGEFLDIAFEVVSAVATVGLTRGETFELDGFGRAVIILIMFLGRVGPLTLGFFLATRVAPRVGYPKGRIFIG